MLNKIKALADEAIALQNKNRMDDVLREISALCEAKVERKTYGTEKEFDTEAGMVADITGVKAKPVKVVKNAK